MMTLRSVSTLLALLLGSAALVACTITTNGGASPAADAGTSATDDAAPATTDGGAGSDAQPVGASSPVASADAWLDGWTGAAQGPNSYAHESGGAPLAIQWGNDVGADGQFTNLSDCSFFASKLLERSFAWTDTGLSSWLCQGHCPVGRPQAVHFHDAVVAESHFARITDVRNVARGDILSMAYHDGSKDTGHFMLAEAAPVALCTTCSPLEYSVAIIDSADGYHGNADTRYTSQTCSADADCGAYTQGICDTSTGTCTTTGIGRGTVRLYADANYQITGYSWSTAASSKAYFNSDSPLLRDLAVGRYDGSAGN